MSEVVTLNTEKAKSIVPKLIEAWDTNRVLRPNNLPQNRFLSEEISKGSLEHRNFLFAIAAAMKARVNSDDVFIAFRNIYGNNPLIFSPEYLWKFGELAYIVVLNAIEKETRIFEVEKVARSWTETANALAKFDFDPLNIFKGVVCAYDVVAILKKLFGWGEKTIRLLIVWFEEAGFIERLHGAPPFDFHFFRNSLLLNFWEIEGLTPDLTMRVDKAIRLALPQFENFCEQSKILTFELDAVMWLLSRVLCVNKYKSPALCQAYCPVVDLCTGPFIRYRDYRNSILKLYQGNTSEFDLFAK